MTTSRRSGRPDMIAVLAGVLGVLVVVAYVAIVVTQGDNRWDQVVGWALFLAMPCALAFASLRLPQRGAFWTRVAAALLFAAFGIVTSLGLGLLPAAVLIGLAAYQTRASARVDQANVRT
jgi:hypothetical protein